VAFVHGGVLACAAYEDVVTACTVYHVGTGVAHQAVGLVVARDVEHLRECGCLPAAGLVRQTLLPKAPALGRIASTAGERRIF
jgi:hypothetical protein